MKNLKSHFVFNRSQRNGIFLLVLLILSLQLLYFFLDFSSETEIGKREQKEITGFQRTIDSLKEANTKADTLKIFPFNPNYITDFKGYTLGMSPTQIDNLLAYRKTGKFVNSANEFQKVTGVSDSLLAKISPYFKFPDWVNKANAKKRTLSQNVSRTASKELNSATAEDLKSINGIGEVLASRIVNYRNKIGGFLDIIQLKDIYGLNFELRAAIQKEFVVKAKPTVKLLDINRATTLELTEVPYFNYELAREIVDFRQLHEKISSFEELAQIKDFPSEKIDRIALYLSLK